MVTSSSVAIGIPVPMRQTIYVTGGADAKKGTTRRVLWRSWKQLSRFQRSLLTMLAGLLTLSGVYYYHYHYSGSRGDYTVHQTERASLDQLSQVKNRDKAAVLPQLDFEPPRPRNKVEAVNLALEEDENKNRAKEEQDEDDFVDEDDEKGDDEGEQDDDSNQAGESFKELPPKDRSLVFKGPQNERQKAVVEAFKHAWDNYKTYAWGKDHLKPLSKTGHNWFGVGLTIIDSLDTLLMMNLESEFTAAQRWVEKSLDFSAVKGDVNFFETSIRVLGGLLSAFHLSGQDVFLQKAKDLGDRLMGAFESPSGIPYSDVNLKTRIGHSPKWSPDSSTSEVTTVQLEFRDLSRVTGDSRYEDAAAEVSRKVHEMPKKQGLVQIYINANTGKLRQQSTITLGARGDSYYEYLLKQWLQTGKTVDFLKEDFLLAMEGVRSLLVRRTVPNRLLYIGEILSGGKDFKHKMDELTCFLPGTLALGVHNGLPKSLMTLAEELAYTCYLTFARHPTHLAAELTYFNSEPGSTVDFYVKPSDSHYLLRPETIEGFWYLYYFTGNKTYQDWGWKIFQGIEKYTKVKNGYTTIGNVMNPLDLRPRDMMESFLLGETFKYLYLLFADRQEIDLDQWVINTEAHPLPMYPE